MDQKQHPDEVVVCDDQSTDNTIEILQQLAAEAPFPVHISQNSTRLGFNKNFEGALSACTGDLIFICDQDDHWLPEKISRMTQYMIDHPEAQLTFCNSWVTDEDLNGRESRFWEWIRFDKQAQKRWKSGDMMDVMLDGNRVMGCATVIRRTYLATILPIPTEIPGYIYDGWIGLVGAAENTIHFLDIPLQLYRTHGQQEVGVRVEEPMERIRLRDRLSRHRAKKLAPLREKQAQLTVINRLLSERVSPDAPGIPLLRRRLSHFTMRSCLPHDRIKRLGPVLNSLRQGNYKRYADVAANWYAPYLAALGDLLE
ncbi:glycosyl transferase family 2 [Spirosoma montaniterrae]|uniref:Glycosyl transferase family 2 n=1 Tax=Spirosoma montaniterrae TaxID=1178516 RepID=A0A1P9X459_9BACT|nr:glycosyl transferase family 2 [Spirosoma montaniterrae]